MLLIAQFTFNNSKLVIRISPFYVNYRQHPNEGQDPKGIKPIAKRARVTVNRMKELYVMLQKELERISKESAKHANKKRSKGPDLQEGGMVYLLRKNIKTKRPNNKLNYTKLGLFRINAKLEPVIYKLELPKTMKIHNVFHIFLLELALENAQPARPTQLNNKTQDLLYKVKKITNVKMKNS